MKSVCPVSAHKMDRIFTGIILAKYQVDYFKCPGCGLINTEAVHWLSEAYTDAIAKTDTGLVSRNILNQGRLEAILFSVFGEGGSYTDVGGGYGMLCRLMRDIGFDFYTTDAYCENILAPGFEPLLGLVANALVAFEVFEHLEQPFDFVRDAFEKFDTKTIIFSTLLQPEEVPPADWWYYAFETGQHITFYTKKALEELARRVGCKFYSLSDDLHIITDRGIPPHVINTLSNSGKFKKLQGKVRKKRRKLSETWSDHLLMKERL
jgi:hypothetical protein